MDEKKKQEMYLILFDNCYLTKKEFKHKYNLEINKDQRLFIFKKYNELFKLIF